MNSTTKMQSWLILIVVLFAWIMVGFALTKPNYMGVAPITDVAVLLAYFGLVTTVILPTLPQAYKSYKEKKLNCTPPTA